MPRFQPNYLARIYRNGNPDTVVVVPGGEPEPKSEAISEVVETVKAVQELTRTDEILAAVNNVNSLVIQLVDTLRVFGDSMSEMRDGIYAAIRELHVQEQKTEAVAEIAAAVVEEAVTENAAAEIAEEVAELVTEEIPASTPAQKDNAPPAPKKKRERKWL